MRRLVVTALLVTGCAGSGLSAAEQKQRCADFAAEVAKAKLSTTPSQDVALDVANALDAKLSRLGAPAVHDPAVDVHAELHNVEAALKKGDQERADRAAGKARERIQELAEACGLPESAFLG